MSFVDHAPVYPEGSVILAPLSGYTDLPFREACRACGCRFAFTPLVDAGSLVRATESSRLALLRGEDERWLGAQLLGSSPGLLAEATRILNGRDVDLLDLNLGCPVPKVTRKGAGAALLDRPALAAECLAAMARESRVPVSAKIRVLSAIDPAPTIALALALEEAGAAAITIHGRTREKVYAGPVATGVIAAVRARLAVPVVANGGVTDAASARRLREETGCSRIMVARGAIGNPWLFGELAGDGGAARPPPGNAQVCDTIGRHVRGMVRLYGEEEGIRTARKVVLSYMAGRGYRRARKVEACGLRTLGELEAFLAALAQEGPSPRYHAARGGEAEG